MNNENVDVMILCGGLGLRLRDVALDRPKPMVLVNNKPFLEYVVDYLVLSGFKRFIFCVGYKADIIRNHFLGYRQIEAIFSEEKELLGTGGAIKLAESHIKSSYFLVVNGDSICELDMDSFIDFYVNKKPLLLMALVKVDGRDDCGHVEMGEDGCIKAFREKIKGTNASHINSGTYLFDKQIFDFIPYGYRCSLEQDVIPKLLNDRQVYGFISDCNLYDIGTPERLRNFYNVRMKRYGKRI